MNKFHRCKIFKSKTPYKIMYMVTNQHNLSGEFSINNIHEKLIYSASSRVYYWVSHLCEVGYIEKIDSVKGSRSMFRATQQGKKCFECYIRVNSSYYADFIADEEELPSACILNV